ncbi:MAG: MaoC family dehydratase N-terminal domain-containing protein [Dehalococcoidia bacterium]|nr:MaoC family dehydratase N-terminal domain-containing protein [Dehalococcoidia bacterium]
MAEGPIITEEMRKNIGVESEPITYEVEKGAINKLAEAIGDPNPLWRDEEYAKKGPYGGIVASPTFVISLRHDPFMEKVKQMASFKRIMNGGNDVEYFQPIRPGDIISVTGKIADIRERETKTGKMAFLTLELTYRNHKGDVAAKIKNVIIGFA